MVEEIHATDRLNWSFQEHLETVLKYQHSGLLKRFYQEDIFDQIQLDFIETKAEIRINDRKLRFTKLVDRNDNTPQRQGDY